MPRLPAPEDFGMSAPRASRGVTEISPVVGRPDLATGKAMQDIGALMQQEAEKLDETVALDALNQLQNKQLDLTYGDNGFTKVQGKGVIDRKITAEFPTQLQTEAERLAGTINSPRARAAFEARAGGVMRGFKANVYTHAAKETETYQQQAFQGAVATGVKAAEAGDFAAGVSHVLPVLEAEIARRQLPQDAADDLRRETLGAVYSTGITKALTDGRPAEAKALLETASPWMTPKQTEHFGKMVKEQTSYDKAGQLADYARASGMTEAEAYTYFRKEAAGDKDTAETAKGIFGQYRAMQDRDDAKTLAPLQLTFLEQGGNFAAQAKIIKSPGYINAPERVQVQIRDYMTSHARAMQSFGRSEEAYWENKKATDPEVLVAFGNIANSPETLVQYDDAQLQVAMLPVLGKVMTSKLLQYKHQVAGEAQKFKIPKDLVEQAMPPELQKPKTGVQAQQKDRFDGLVTEGLMDWKLANPGKQPDQQQQKEIIAAAARQISTPGMIFGTNEYPAYAFKPMPNDFIEAAQTKAQASRGRKLTQTELQNLWATQKDARIK